LTRHGKWPEPEGDWLPIARAVFRFAIAHSDGPQSTEAFQDHSRPFSIEAFKKFKGRQDEADIDVVENKTDALSLHNLTATLRDTARAHQADINLNRGYFEFAFNLPTGGVAATGGSPWALLYTPREPLKIAPRLEAEALFNRDGFVSIGDEAAKHQAQQVEAMRAATDRVWNGLMLPTFDRSVSAGRVKVYARVQPPLAQFQQLPADLWLRLKVGDWQHGIACDPEANRYYSIHAAESLLKDRSPQAEVLADPLGLVLTKGRNGPGRKKGQGSYERLDQQLFSKMKELIAAMKAASPEEAARMVALEAHGSGSIESKTARLARRYRKSYSD
jgi:hypothetical protein